MVTFLHESPEKDVVLNNSSVQGRPDGLLLYATGANKSVAGARLSHSTVNEALVSLHYQCILYQVRKLTALKKNGVPSGKFIDYLFATKVSSITRTVEYCDMN
ncbi:hypothetical protein KIN20_031942 [Parelaphostrongylus tenuis]|uniref:Uncharacterized protein n=1 Tax=Parelaphostrongylus tenuis TaxID=148309 RepID=A0AAD5WI42_PARTN|nr:hypothetical protein KIN20_031942 [Parelaphostrongylus tenuis]